MVSPGWLLVYGNAAAPCPAVPAAHLTHATGKILIMEHPASSFHSRFGGLWLDRNDAADRIASMRSSGAISQEEAEKLARFSKEGYAILPQAADADAIASFEAAIADGFAHGNPELRVQT